MTYEKNVALAAANKEHKKALTQLEKQSSRELEVPETQVYILKLYSVLIIY